MKISLCILFLITPQSQAFASWFVTDFCERKLEIGQVIMNSIVADSEERIVKVYREDRELNSGDVYIPGERVKIHISNNQDQYVFEAKNAIFEKGKCGGVRTDKDGGYLILPTNALDDVEIWTGSTN